MGRRVLAIIAAAVIALIGAVLVLLYARGADERAVAEASPSTVYVTSLAVPAGVSLKEAIRLKQVTQTQVPAASVPAGALTVVDDTNSALVALTGIAPGQIVLAAAFGEVPIGETKLQVGAGKLAVSVSLSDPARVGTFVSAGSTLTIFMTYQLKNLEASEEAQAFNEQDVKGTSVLLNAVKVLAVGNASLTPTPTPADGDPAAQNQAPNFLVTLEVTPEQATRLVHGINNYTLYAGLHGSEVEVNPRLTVNDRTMLGAAIQ